MRRPVVLDLETFDPFLKERGTDAHCRRWGGFIFLAGLYKPAENITLTMNWNEEAADVIRSMLDQGGWDWYGANIKYDLVWLLSEGVLRPHHTHNNRFYDILIDAPLIDETQPFSFYKLDGQAQHYGLPTKPIDSLIQAADEMGLLDDKGNKLNAKTVWTHLFKLPRGVVKEYLTHDLVTTWEVAQKQAPLIAENKLERVRELESLLLPVLAMMEHEGVRVDVDAAQQLYEQAFEYIKDVQRKLRNENGGNEVPLTASNALTQFILDRGHRPSETPSSEKCRAHKVKLCPECLADGKKMDKKYSLSASTLQSLALIDPLLNDLISARKAEKIAKDFAQGAIIDTAHNGRVHGNINQIIGAKDGDEKDGQGVRFGRLSMSKPNLQQVPKKDSVEIEGMGGLGSAMRRLFVAEDGCEFMSGDFSSQEPRWIIHWCETWNCPGAGRVGDMYRANPAISSHDIVAGGIEGDLPAKKKRDLAKIINLGKGYEMGIAKLISNLVAAGVPPEQAQRIMDDYDANFPHVKSGSNAAKGAAERLGYVRTALGRKIHFNDFEPTKYGAGPAMPYEQAYALYVEKKRLPIRRAYTYRAFNRVVQGSSADQTKQAMVILWYEHGILPTLQVHDELTDAKIQDHATVKIYKHVMETAIPLTIPSLTEIKLGPNWKDGVLFNV
ncbi:MAG TPA: DNA polymerase [Dongiaceae bacterium]|nr:DNA polymerase [Dongiaceae bacterium]